MKLSAIICTVAVLLFGLLSGEPENSDPYLFNFVAFELKLRSGGRKVITSVGQKNLQRLGDAVSLPLMKLVGEKSVLDADTANGALMIIQEAFSEPQLISAESDRKPVATILLLKRLSESVTDIDTQRRIHKILTRLQVNG